MKKIFLILALLMTSLFAQVSKQYPSQQFLDSKIPIVDIRTPGEWKEDGILQGAHTIMFFDINGQHDIKSFLEELNAQVDTTKPFALICRTGSRTQAVANFLSSQFGYKVIDLVGGMIYIKAQKLPITPYKATK